MTHLRILIAAVALAGCGGPPNPGARDRGAPPTFALGEWQDDYGERYTISAEQWLHLPSATYRIVEWNRGGRFLVAQNGKDNWTDKGLWTRIDWIQLDDMEPFRWAFCMAAFKEPTADAARSVQIAKPRSPRTGCNGFPYSRMKPAN